MGKRLLKVNFALLVSLPCIAHAGADPMEQTLAEVVVTAQKREERAQDVPIPISALDASRLVENNQTKLTDFYTQVPGLSMAPSSLSTQTMSIRGITTGAVGTGASSSPTVGVVVDDVPFGSSFGSFTPDFDPSALARIEVLRGPQGSLYGASSMGGLIKFVTLDPSTDSLSGRLEAGASGVDNGAQPGFEFRGSVNAPLSSTAALRASAFIRQDPGYIDNPVLGVKGLNEAHSSGGHFVVLWRPSDTLSLKMSALFQDARGDGTNDVTPNPPPGVGAPGTLGPNQQYYVRGVGPYDRKAQVYSAILVYKLGSVDLTALSGYNTYKFNDSIDFTSYVGAATQQVFGVLGSPIFDSFSNSRFTQEIRLSSSIGRFDWLVGGFYSHEDLSFQQVLLASEAATGRVVGHWLTQSSPMVSTESAGFGDLTFHFTGRFDVQVGGRASKFDITNKSVTNYGVYYSVFSGIDSGTQTIPEQRSTENAFTYLLTPRFKLSPNLMAYARIASGYRAGGNNFGTPGVPPSYSPDKTKNYEIGVKGDFLERSLSVDASIYYIDWKDIQLSLVSPTTHFSYTGNAGAAKSQGAEFSVESRPLRGLTIGAWIDWTDAVLTQDIPGAGTNGVIYGYSGDRLPYSPRFSANLSVKKEFPLTANSSGFLGASVAYVGDREDEFPNTSPARQALPAYVRTDATAGVTLDNWLLTLYANNLMNRAALISGGAGNAIPYSFYYIQPRTIGFSIARQF